MAHFSKEDILRKVEEENIQFIRLQFTDVFGVFKNVAITSRQLEKALDGEMMFDGSSIDGYVSIEDSDMYLQPDFDSFLVFPWQEENTKEARLICDVYKSDKTAFTGDPRYVLKEALREAEEKGYYLNVGPECEFFLFPELKGKTRTLTSIDGAGYFDMDPLDRGEIARKEMVINLEKMGFEVEAFHHEAASDQHEIGFKYQDALSIADGLMTFKYVIKTIARKNQLFASFMPKPRCGIAGSGMHTNISLSDREGRNLFYSGKEGEELSETAYFFMAGVLDHIKAISLLSNPLVNSYKRLVAGFEAPVYIAWSTKNRSPLIRIPAKRGPSTRIELRNPDAAANPYFLLTAILKAGLDGLEKKKMPRPAVNLNIYDLTEAKRTELEIDSLPDSLEKAILEFKKDDLIYNCLGEHIRDYYVGMKEAEWLDYKRQVHTWEIRKYFDLI